MRYLQTFFQWIKPILSAAIIVGLLLVTGLFDDVSYVAQSAIMKTGVLNASTTTEDAPEDFDYGFGLQDLDGNKIEASELKDKVIFLNLWATWCGPCRVEMPSIQQLYETTSSNENIVFIILSIDASEDKEKVRNYIRKKGFTFPVYMPRGYLTQQLTVPSIPTTFIVSKEGKVVRKEVGTTNFGKPRFAEFLQKLTQ